ncbi:MAG: DHH family phosphoesterase, partial [Phycisphaerae bacterium]
MGAAWVIAEPWSGRGRLAAALGVCPIVAQILHNRGLDDPGAARRFLRPQLSELEGPEALPGAVEAAGRLARAVREGRRIVIYGDYDVDGIAGTAILWRCLRLAGGQVDFYVPHRLEEGYGLNSEAIEKLADEQVQVVVTVDCGITAVGAAELARRRGVELIITDHHEAGPDLPQGCTIVHPTALSGGYGNADLSGAGVALKLAWAVGQHFSAGKRVSEEFREFLVDATSLAGLGTIADVVPLVGENRVLAHFGLMGLRHCRQEGLRALIAESGLAGRKLESYHVGFWLGPRLNAAGRMGHARLAVELLTRASGARAREIARFLAEQNRQRQQVERRILAEARQMVAETGMDGDAWRAIVLARAGWHAGVIGIVASRLVEQYCRPVVLIAVDGGEIHVVWEDRGDGSYECECGECQ